MAVLLTMGVPPGSYGDLDALSDAPQGNDSLAGTQAEATDQGAAAPAAPSPVPTDFTFSASGGSNVSMPGLYVTPDDNLVVNAWNSNPNLTSLAVQIRILQLDGTLQITGFVLPNLTHDRTQNTASFQLPPGMIVGAVIGPPGIAMSEGQCFANLAVVRGTPTNPLMQLVLTSGYVTSGYQPSWPYSTMRNATDGRGYIYQANASEPAPGVAITITVPAGARWVVRSLYGELQTSAAAGNRQVIMEAIINTSVFQVPAPSVQPASTDSFYTFAPIGGAGFGPVTQQVGPSPFEIYFPAGSVLELRCPNMQAGDQFIQMQLIVEEWVDV